MDSATNVKSEPEVESYPWDTPAKTDLFPDLTITWDSRCRIEVVHSTNEPEKAGYDRIEVASGSTKYVLWPNYASFDTAELVRSCNRMIDALVQIRDSALREADRKKDAAAEQPTEAAS